MPSPEKRDGKLTGFWYGEVRLKATGERFRKRFETKKEAKGYEEYIKTVGREPMVEGAKFGGPTFAKVVELARQHKDGWKDGNVRDKSGQHRLNHLVNLIGPMPIESVNATVIADVVQSLSRRPNKKGDGTLSKGTINRYLAALSAVLDFALGRELIKVRPVIAWKDEDGQRIHFYTAAQEQAIVSYMRAQGWLGSALTVRVLAASGLRWGEFISLEAKQLQSVWIKLDKTKTNTPRDVPIPAPLMMELRTMIVSGDRPNYLTFRMQLKSAVKACGYPEELGIHNLRHTTATRMTKKGKPGAVIQKFLGHKSYSTTLKYTHVEDDQLLDAAGILDPQGGIEAETEVATVLPFASKTA